MFSCVEFLVPVFLEQETFVPVFLVLVFHDPQNSLGKTSGYLHVNKTATLTEAAVQTWIIDDQINGEVKWSPGLSRGNGNWKQRSIINSIFAACKAGGSANAPGASRTGWAKTQMQSKGEGD